MSNRLIDSGKPFRPVYSLYRHESLGVLASAHVVQELENGRLSLVHQSLLPENMDQFQHKLDNKDRKLIRLLDELSIRKIIKKFSTKPIRELDFFLKVFKEQVKKLILEYINRRMVQAIPLLKDREVYIMGNDGYPARDRVQVLDEKGSVHFHFLRTDEDTRYYPTIKLRGELLKFRKFKDSAILCNEPAWMLCNKEIFTFEGGVEGNKLRPFLKKWHISIPRSSEQEYFRKFGTQLVERYKVITEGLRIESIREQPHFLLIVDGSQKDILTVQLQVQYGRFTFPVNPEKNRTAQLEKDGDSYKFFRIDRHPGQEMEIMEFMQSLGEKGKLTGWEYMEKQKGLSWLSRHIHNIQDMGIEIIQDDEQARLNFHVPEIKILTEESGDWFDIKAVVSIGNFQIPFLKFKQHILKNKRDYILPDGSVAILPESWFTDYRHLVEVAVEKGEETLSIRKYQAGLLTLEGQQKGHEFEKLQQLFGQGEIESHVLPGGLKAELRSYQRKGYDWLFFLQKGNFGGILADDMGLGKTLQTLSLLLQEKEAGSEYASLVIMPTSLLYNWQQEALRFTPELKVKLYAGINRTKDPDTFAGMDLILTTYGIVRQDLKIFREYPFHYIILDESQMIKNPASKTSKAVKKLHGRHRLSLTGTPLENTLMDLWSQMSFLNPGLLGSETFFKNFYCQPIEKQQDQQRTEQLKRIIHPFILRRTKEQVADELPPKIEQIHYCEMEEAQQQLYDETKNAYRNYLLELIQNRDFNKKKLNLLSGLQKLRQIAIHPNLVEAPNGDGLLPSGKYQEFLRLLEEVIAKGSKVLVFSQFVKLLTLIRNELKEREIRHTYLDGATRDRMAEVAKFQEDPDIPVFLISLKAGGVGLNLTAAQYVFILDPWWNPAVENQAIDRSYRIGQKKTVFSYKFITRDSIEEKIVKLQERKSRLSDEIVSVEADIFKKLEIEDLQELLA